MCVCVCCAFVGLDNKLYKMHGTYIKILKNTNLHHNKRKNFQVNISLLKPCFRVTTS